MPELNDRHDDGIDTTTHDVHASRRAVNRTLDRLADTAADWRDGALPVVDRVAERARDIARQGAGWVRDGRDVAGRTAHRTVGYVQHEPMRAALMAAAAGVVLVALVHLLSGRRSRY
jgi:ElaB/YqjD/DUF883 family membrane-anchored ribosome-binding protein